MSAAGIAGVHPHLLRHTWASHSVLFGASTLALQSVGGWSDSVMVAHYSESAQEEASVTSMRALNVAERLIEGDETSRRRDAELSDQLDILPAIPEWMRRDQGDELEPLLARVRSLDAPARRLVTLTLRGVLDGLDDPAPDGRPIRRPLAVR